MLANYLFKSFVLSTVLASTLTACGSLKKTSTSEKGDAGSQGPTGQDGARGPAGGWEAYALKTGKHVGLMMGGIYQPLQGGTIAPVQLPDGSKTYLEMDTGIISVYARGYETTNVSTGEKQLLNLGDFTCLFTTTDCTGTCYLGGDATSYSKPAKDVLVLIGQRWFKGTGSEADAGALTSKSERVFGGACTQQQRNWVHSYPVTEYTPPAGFEYPFGGLDIRPNTL